ncbi:hypothetical protein LLE49_25855 [Alicyclobacillus tolerans]|uniref:hypothetical protein n=1 Tax=Alicyclobacillus tolerans TaxID=90970 RepID=UPI001F29769D|nr:hypothetical protein [Alicyclobacillus tolerans]MCF8568154.1 hypothetical protein [Alicyclobacillus tolerans]
MPKRNFNLTTEVDRMLEQYHAKQKTIHPRITRQQIVNEAIKLYTMMEQRDRAEEIFEQVMENRFRKFENRLAAMIAAVGIDVDMILVETLEAREALLENQKVDPKVIYSELRKEGVKLFQNHKAFRMSEL